MKLFFFSLILVSQSLSAFGALEEWPMENSSWKLEKRTCASGRSLISGPGELHLRINNSQDPSVTNLSWDFRYTVAPSGPGMPPFPCNFVTFYEMKVLSSEPHFINYVSGSMTSSCVHPNERKIAAEWRAFSYEVEDKDADHIVIRTYNSDLCSVGDGLVLNTFSRIR